MRYPAIGTLLAACIFAAHPLAQPQAPKPIFEVASVKPGTEVSWSRGVKVTPGRFTSTDMPLTSLIIRAYGVPFWKIKNAPDWVKTEPFTVQAHLRALVHPGTSERHVANAVGAAV